MRSRVDVLPYRLVLPAVLMELIFVAVPVIYGFYYSLHKVDYFRLGTFVGLQNYRAILTSPEFWNSMLVTGVFTVFSLTFTLVIGFALAIYLNRDVKANVFLRAIILIPYTISMLVGSLLIKWLLSQDSGIINILMSPFGVRQLSILSDPTKAMVALVANAVWRDSAFAMVLLMAGLKSIPIQLYRAASVDGASSFYQFKRITIPLMKTPIIITVVRLVIHFFNNLTIPLVLTGGGPLDATRTISIHLYKLGFEQYRFGPANALAFLVLLFNVLLILILLRFFKDTEVG